MVDMGCIIHKLIVEWICKYISIDMTYLARASCLGLLSLNAVKQSMCGTQQLGRFENHLNNVLVEMVLSSLFWIFG